MGVTIITDIYLLVLSCMPVVPIFIYLKDVVVIVFGYIESDFSL